MEKVALRSNWKLAYSLFTGLQDKLQISAKELSPINKLSQAREKAEVLLSQIQEQSIYVVGNVPLQKHLQIVVNRIDGLQNGLRTRELNSKTIQPILEKTRQSLDPVLAQLELKINKQNFNQIVETAQSADINSDTFHDFSDAMQTIMRRMQSNQSGDVDKSQSRDLIHMSNIMEKNKKDLQSMKDQLKDVYSPEAGENFHVVRGPILTAALLDQNKLNWSGIDYDVVYFPGIRFGHARKEETPRMFILRDQILVAVVFKNPTKFSLKLKGKSIPQKMADENERFKEISTDVVNILEHKLHERYIQVGTELGKYITSKEFPGIKFMLLMKQSVYQKIGPFSSSNTLVLPF